MLFLPQLPATPPYSLHNPAPLLRQSREIISNSIDLPDGSLHLTPDTVPLRAVHHFSRLPVEGGHPLHPGDHGTVQAGERALGKEPFQEDAGHFWGILSTRPYMRARAALAEFLWWNRNYDESIEVSKETLRLNPGDNQGIRYVLAQRLMAVDRDDDFAALYKEFEDDGSATFAYSQALWLFRKDGASSAADVALSEAVKCNPYVPEYLLLTRKMPSQLPDYYGIGDRNEAIIYATEAIEAWARSKGALLWLRSRCRRHGGRR